MNLLEETIKVLENNGKSINDIVAVQGKDFGISIKRFLKLADTEYNEGKGEAEVAEDLVIIGKDWWLERAENDGAEWWEFRKFPSILPVANGVKALTIHQKKNSWGWETLKTLNWHISANKL